MDQPMGSAVVATDNYAAGYKLGSYMKHFVKADSVIGIVGHVKGSSTAVGREAGFRAGLGEAGTQVAEIVFCDSDSDKAYEQTKDLLKKYPSMDLIVGLNEYSAVGAARAVGIWEKPTISTWAASTAPSNRSSSGIWRL